MLVHAFMLITVSGILCVALYAWIRIQGRKRYIIIGCLGFMLVGSCFLGNYPIDALIHTFPTPEAVAEYVCPGKLLEIIDGEESALIVYQDEKNSLCTMVAPKTQTGYRVGGYNSDVTNLSTSIGACHVTIRESRRCSDRYVAVFGLISNNVLTVTDSMMSQFSVLTYPYPADDTLTIIGAFAFLNEFDINTYELTIDSGNDRLTAYFRNN